MQPSDFVRTPTEQQRRMTQLWDWGHNCKVMGMTKHGALGIADAFNFDHILSSEEYDRFWEGYYAPKSRTTLVPIHGLI